MATTLSQDNDATGRAAKLRKLETCESLAMLQSQLIPTRSSDASSHASAFASHEPHVVRVTVQRGRLALLSAVVVVAVIALSLCLRHGVVLDRFARRAVSTQEQERLVESYNAYSGTITAALERPLELFTALIAQVVVVRLLARDVLDVETQRRTAVAAIALSVGTTYLLTNGLSAVNVQAREQPIRLAITTNDLAVQVPEPTASSSLAQSFAEMRVGNPVTNTILRNLILPRATTATNRPPCSALEAMDDVDDVLYRLPQHAWMKHLLPHALTPASLTVVVSKANAAANDALSPEQLPMNATLAADLLLYSLNDPVDGSAWGRSSDVQGGLMAEFHAHANATLVNANPTNTFPPTARLTRLLPPSRTTIERDDREWFLTHSGPAMYNISNRSYRNASLRSWTMTFSHIDIAPGSVWVDAVTIEREMATPRLQPNASRTNSTTPPSSSRFLPLETSTMEAAANYVPLRRAGGDTTDASDRIDAYSVCVDAAGNDVLTSEGSLVSCSNQSTHSLLVVGRGKQLVADALVHQPFPSPPWSTDAGWGRAVNVREISTVTIARITWTLQNLSTIYNARCDDAKGGCMGLDVALPTSRQRLVVSANALPVGSVRPLIQYGMIVQRPLSIVSVRRPQFFTQYKADGARFIGDLLMPHNIRAINSSTTETKETETANDACERIATTRIAAYVDNHVYIEHALQPTYTAAAFFLFQNGRARDIVNQTWTTTRTMLAFDGNAQDVDVYVYIPWLNVLLTLTGCGLLGVMVLVVVLWPHVRSYARDGRTDPLDRITDPHAIATVLLNEAAFPPLLLTRSVDATTAIDNADAFFIESLSLQQKDDVAVESIRAEDDDHDSIASPSPSPSRATRQLDPLGAS